MRFISAAIRAKYVVKPKRNVVIDGVPQPVPGLTARFFGHVFDSDKSQRELGWTDKERTQVEDYLLGHHDYNFPRGFYLENAGDMAAPVTTSAKRCIAFFKNEAGEAEQCGNEPVGDADYCAAHLPQMAEA